MDPPYYVIYSRMGQIIREPFENLNEATEDYNEKLRLDASGVFDDRFVIKIEDAHGNTILSRGQ